MEQVRQPVQRRMTRQRRLILDVLVSRRDHPTAEDILVEVRKKMAKVSLGTVYRNLEILGNEGRVRVLEAPGQCRRYDGFTHDHLHIQCTRCGRVGDLEDASIPDITSMIGRSTPFRVTGFLLQVQGICDECNNRVTDG